MVFLATTPGGIRVWAKLLHELNYLNNLKVLGCPSNASPDSDSNRQLADFWGWNSYGVYRGDADADYDTTKAKTGDFYKKIDTPETHVFLLGRMKAPSDTVLMIDAVWQSGEMTSQFSPHGTLESGKTCQVLQHNDRATSGFADGHVKAMSGGELKGSALEFSVVFDSSLTPKNL